LRPEGHGAVHAKVFVEMLSYQQRRHASAVAWTLWVRWGKRCRACSYRCGVGRVAQRARGSQVTKYAHADSPVEGVPTGSPASADAWSIWLACLDRLD